MRVLLTVSNWPSHYHALIPLAWTLQAQGHQVIAACDPGQSARLTACGLTAAPLLHQTDLTLLARVHNYLKAVAGQWDYPFPPLNPETRVPLDDLADFDFAGFRDRSRGEQDSDRLDGLRALTDVVHRWRPDAILADPMASEGLLAAAAGGVPVITHLWGPAGLHTDDWGGLDPEGPQATKGFEEIVPDFSVSDLDHRVVDPRPTALKGLDSRHRHLPIRFVPFAGGGLIDVASPTGEVAVVWGQSAAPVFGTQSWIVDRIVRAACAVATSVVATVSDADRGALSDDMDTRAAIVAQGPLQPVLRETKVMIHHGGAGSTMTAAAQGIPQLIIRTAVDAELNSHRVETAGIGLGIAHRDADEATISAAVQRLLSESGFAARAAAVAEEIREAPDASRVGVALSEGVRESSHGGRA